MIAHVCLVYYYLNEYFDPKLTDSSITFEAEDRTDCIIGSDWWKCAYLHKIVSSGKHHWKFKLECKRPEIGIAKKDSFVAEVGYVRLELFK